MEHIYLSGISDLVPCAALISATVVLKIALREYQQSPGGASCDGDPQAVIHH